LHKPQIVQGDRGYSSEPHRQRLRERCITPLVAKIGSPHGSGLGKTRWPVERSIAWLHLFRRLKSLTFPRITEHFGLETSRVKVCESELVWQQSVPEPGCQIMNCFENLHGFPR
jgi:hypothetical protein